MIQLMLRLHIDTTDSQSLLQGLRLLARFSKLERGCLASGLLEEACDSGILHYFEEWDSHETMECRVRSEQFKRLLALAELTSAPPEFEFRFVDEIRGLEYVSALLGTS